MASILLFSFPREIMQWNRKQGILLMINEKAERNERVLEW